MTNLLEKLTKENIRDLLDPKLGAITVPINADCFVEIQKAFTKFNQQFTKAASNPPKTLVSNYSFACLDITRQDSVAKCFIDFAKQLASELNDEINRHFNLSEQIEFDDLYFTRYDVSEMGVGPHRDVNCKNFVVVLVLEGSAPFYVCEDKEIAGKKSVSAKLGQIMIMRARNFLDLPAPLHYVGAIKSSPMLQFGMRQYINKPNH
ncbi:MAG: hypothetical protein K9M11_02385 [Candidatus Pacebacteria bacterium]|nr:hypothetical protein [Candidatus Paceibacterota bacterium]